MCCHMLAQGGADTAGEFQAGVDIWHDGEMASANDDGIGEDMFEKWSRAVGGRQDGKHGLRVAVANPFCATFREADGVHEGFHRRELGCLINTGGLQNCSHARVGERGIIESREGGFHTNAGEAAFVERGEAGAGCFHEKCAIAEIGACIAFSEDCQAALLLADFA